MFKLVKTIVTLTKATKHNSQHNRVSRGRITALDAVRLLLLLVLLLAMFFGDVDANIITSTSPDRGSANVCTQHAGRQKLNEIRSHCADRVT